MEKEYFDSIWRSCMMKNTDSASLWDNRAEEFNSHSVERKKERTERVLSLLEGKGLLRESFSILDIGCGPGRFAVSFSPKVKEVVGIDVSGKMLEFANRNTAAAEAENVSFIQGGWDQLDLEERGWKNRFDLVFASMCPGINCSDALLKMCSASRGHCYMSSFVERHDSVMEYLGKKTVRNYDGKRWGKGMYSAFNILWLSGFRPEIEYHVSAWENERSIDAAVEFYSGQMGVDNPEGISALIDEMEKISVDGVVRSKTESKIAMMSWSVA